jgi:hypothetical protein
MEQKESKEGKNIDESIQPHKGKNKDIIIIYSALIIFVIVISIIFFPKLINRDTSYSLDELHSKNLQGKLSDEGGYMHDGLYSFVKYDGLWYTQIVNPAGDTLFNIPFHYRPDEVAYIPISGSLNRTNLDRWKSFFMTFDPLDDDLGHIGVAIGETDGIVIKVFGKGVIGSCTSDEVEGCKGVPIVKCNSTDAPVFYFKSEPIADITYENNCIIVSGAKDGLLKATDRMLFDILGIIK